MPAERHASTAARLGLSLATLALVAGCASGPPRGGATTSARPAPASDASPASPRGADGPPASPPADLASVADAEPRVEPIRAGGPNKPYQALGRDYVPSVAETPFVERGLASWYGRKFHGRRTANGEIYDMYAMTAAHPTLPIPSYARIRNPANGKVVIVRVNDRGPFHAGRIVDLSYVAALKLDLLRGVGPVELERITPEEIRTGAWRRAGEGATRVAAARTAPLVAAAAPVVSESVNVPSSDVALVAAVPTPIPSPAAVVAAEATAPVRPSTDAARGFWIQLGAFRDRDGAQSFQRHVGSDGDAGWIAPLLATFADATLFRVQAGPYPSRDEAEGAATRMRGALGIVPLIVERR